MAGIFDSTRCLYNGKHLLALVGLVIRENITERLKFIAIERILYHVKYDVFMHKNPVQCATTAMRIE